MSLGHALLCAWRDRGGGDSFTFCSAVAWDSFSLPIGAGGSGPGLPTFAGQPETLGGYVPARGQEPPHGLAGTILSDLEGDLYFIRNHSWCQQHRRAQAQPNALSHPGSWPWALPVHHHVLSGTAALHSVSPPTSSSFSMCSQLPFLRSFHAGLYFLDILISSPVIKRRSNAGTFLQAGADLWGCRPKAVWVFFTCARHELFRAGLKAHLFSVTPIPQQG